MPTALAPDGATLAYDASGDGPPLVLAHGITESRRAWDPLIAPLAVDHRVIAVDLRGHGESERRPPYDVATMAADVHAVVEELGASRPLVVGHSLGGAVVSIYSASYPVRGVVNVDQPMELTGFKALLTPLEPLLADEVSFPSVMHQILEPLYGKLSSDERTRLASLAHPEQPVVLGTWDLVLHSSPKELDDLIQAAAGAISAPYLALHGTDPGEAYTTWLRKAVPSAIIEIWPDLGHYPHLVEPDRFVHRLRDFSATYQ